uniref:Si:ch211-117l17.7 n=1 Tax=Astyanax mexicanus TaxID=7994 RepID=A0A8B9L1Q5_ASTMX
RIIHTLSSNALSVLPPGVFRRLVNLEQLHLDGNQLVSLSRMPRLKELYLYNTNLSTVPWNLFANMTGLMSLNLHINEKLTSLPRNLFCCLPNLLKLSLRYNSLQALQPDQFSQLTKLQILLLNGNMLQSLPARIFYNLPKLAKLELSNNYLKNLPGDTFLDLNSLQSVTLGHNRWDCTCSITGFVEWLNQNQRVVSDVDDVLCHKPQLLQNRKLTSLTFEYIFSYTTCTIFNFTLHTDTEREGKREREREREREWEELFALINGTIVWNFLHCFPYSAILLQVM